MDWSGSSAQRKPQGVCLPPKRKVEHIPRFVIPVGTVCFIRKVTESDFRPYRTKKEVAFDRYESRRGSLCDFRMQGWMIRVHWRRMTVNHNTRGA